LSPFTSDFSSDHPVAHRGAGLDWPVYAALQQERLSRYGDKTVRVEDISNRMFDMELQTLLAHVSQPTPRRHVYMRHQLVSELDPALWSLVPSDVRRLNWLAALPSDVRPKWAWIMIGTAATQSPMHVDTAGSAAWNLLCAGTKRWVFHPPQRAQELGLLPAGCHTGSQGESVTFDQYPGDVVVTPSGWAHEVDNLTGTIAITGNFINGDNLEFAAQYFRLVGDDESCALLNNVAEAFSQLPGLS
jgi:JmjC domain-containing hydroxylase